MFKKKIKLMTTKRGLISVLLLILIIIILSTILLLIFKSTSIRNTEQERFFDKPNQTSCKDRLPEATNFFTEKPNYNLQKEELENFYKVLNSSFPSDQVQELKKFFETLQKGSSEAFFVIVRFAQLQPKDFEYAINNWVVKNNNENASILVHEFT